jgi:aspartyl protease family protein
MLTRGVPGQAITANGTVDVYSTMIDRLQIGSITLFQVRASINMGMEQDQILLGMSALKNIEFTHRDGTLTLKQYY